ncbi:MAG: exodeoxyribonuclease V subunit gamma [Deltaproteobacteria bacterium]|nr:exodeoxyribonuclease V subunit gamma [Deltaproteobacteria bacterium]
MLFVERSNRTELLFDGLASRLGRPGRDPLARAVVVVQGAGMERWIAQRLARRHGVCAHVEFPFPRPFLESVFEAIASEGSDAKPPGWDLDRMTWAIAKRIDAGRGDPVYAPLARHLAAADGDWRLVQLAHRIANVFDQYITYRPDWVARFEAPGDGPIPGFDGPDAAWQIQLFRGLVEDLGPGHMERRAADFLDAIAAAPGWRVAAVARSTPPPRIARPVRPPRAELEARLRRRFPDAIEIFAISTLPPLHLEIVRGLASLVDVRLSILAPSRAWYSELWRELREGDAEVATPIAALLSGLGRLGADFQKTIVEGASPEGGEEDRFDVPDAGRSDAPLLARLQSRLLDLDESEQGDAARRVASEDDSIRVHLCHGSRRELEVVLGLLRAAFERDATLRPEDVIVMAPDIDAIAADVEAVFGADADADGQGGLPFRVADRGAYRRSPVAEAFRRLLALLGTRMARSAVFDWLAQADVAARFGLDEAGVEALADWAERAGYRFGLDEAQRETAALPAERGHTLAGSLDRLVLAHALGETREVVAGRTPIGLDAFAEPAWIGAIGEVESLLRGAARELRTPRTVADWTHWLAALLARSIDRQDANSHEHTAILAVLERIRSAALAAGFDRPLAFEAIRERVVAVLEQTPSPQAFLAGGITFCQLVPLRAIPFRIVVVTGLVDGEFPRSHAALGFDAIAKAPRPGDRRLRDDDRHLFLEAILSARDQLILTVPARDLRNGEPRPPSIVVSELLDALESTFVLVRGSDGGGDAAAGDGGPAADEVAAKEAGKELRKWLVVEHPLQATSPRYFEQDRDPRLVSRSARAHRGALARRRVEEAEVLPVRRFLPVGGVPAREGVAGGAAVGAEPLLLDELIERVLRSTRHFARTVLGLRLPRPEGVASDLDPVKLEPLEGSELGRGLFEALGAGEPLDRALERMRANPLLPVGEAGEWLARPVVEEVRAIAAIAAQHRAGPRLPDRAFELDVPRGDGGTVRLVGTLDRLWPNARVEADYGRLGAVGEVALWIRHLVLCALAEAGGTPTVESVFVGRPSADDKTKMKKRVVRFGSVENPLARLAELVALGESVAAAPLPFFARSSRIFAERLGKSPADESQAWRHARDTFEGRDDARFRIPEADEDLETGRVWEGCLPIARAGEVGLLHGFDAVAQLVFTPLLAVRRASTE